MTLGALIGVLAGCALSNPYVKVPSVDEKCAEGCTIDQAQSYSRSVREKYVERLGTHAKLRANSGAAQILLGAAALGLGAADAHRDAFVGTALVGATTFGLSQWFGNPTLEGVYSNGVLALICAEAAVEPLRLSTEETTELSTALRTISTGLPELATAVARLDAAMKNAATMRDSLARVRAGASIPAANQKAIARLGAALAQAAIAQAYGIDIEQRSAAALSSGTKLRHLNAVAGSQLARTVERIVAKINEEARKAQPDPASAFKIVGDLSAIAGRVVPGVDLAALLQSATTAAFAPEQQAKTFVAAARASSPVDDAIDALKSAADEVYEQARSLVAAARAVEAFVALVNNVDVSGTLAGCGVSASPGLSLTPSALAWPQGVNQATVRVTGGNSPYSGTVIGKKADGLVVENPFTGDRTFTIKTTAGVPAAEYSVVISDASGKEVALPLKITAATAPPAVPPPASVADGGTTTAKVGAAFATLSGFLKDLSVPGTAVKITNLERVDASTQFRATVVPAPDAAGAISLAGAIGDLTVPAEGKTVKAVADGVGYKVTVIPR
jgi:hypothetical protein